jgi:hypothetical protein
LLVFFSPGADGFERGASGTGVGAGAEALACAVEASAGAVCCATELFEASANVSVKLKTPLEEVAGAGIEDDAGADGRTLLGGETAMGTTCINATQQPNFSFAAKFSLTP